METEKFLENLEQDVKKKVKQKEEEKKQKYVYKFNYVNLKEKICINTVVTEDQVGVKTPQFVVWNGENTQLCTEFRVPEGFILKVPPIEEGIYRDLYEEIIFPDTIIRDIVTTEIVDEKITNFLKEWHTHPDDYFVIARNYIKYTWIFERFFWRPYLFIFGDYGTGKTEWGSYITRLCQNGLVIDDVSAPTLARLLDITNSVVMLDEMDKIDHRTDAEKMNTILRNGYRSNGRYRVAEQEAKKFMPASFAVDQPKILVKRKMIRDDALASRVIPFKMVPRDTEITDSMRRSDERGWHEQRKVEIRAIVNLLLKWRWQNIFTTDSLVLVPGMMVRFNDTIMSLLKMGTVKDKKIMIQYMKKQEKVAVSSAGDDHRIQIVRFINEIFNDLKTRSIFGTPGTRMLIIDVIAKAKEEIGDDMSEFDFKKLWNPRYVKRNITDLGFEVENHRNKNYIKAESVADLLPRLTQKYNIKLNEEEKDETQTETVDKSKDEVIDGKVDIDV